MRIASITCIFENEFFIKPHFNMISSLDENIVLIGRKPFKEYFNAGFVSSTPDNSEKIIRELYPKAHIVYHDFDSFCGNLLNLGLSKARELNCDMIIKLDVDMLLIKKDWSTFIQKVKESNHDCISLDYHKHTFVYKGDFEHGIECSIFPCGNDPIALKTTHSFIQDGLAIRTTGTQSTTDSSYGNDFMIHHFTQFFRKDIIEERKRVESLPGFTKWLSAPLEIMDMFNK